MDIRTIGFGIDSFSFVSKARGKNPLYKFDIEGIIEIGNEKDEFTGSLGFDRKAESILGLTVLTSGRIASFDASKSIVAVRSNTNDFSILGKVHGCSINDIKAKLHTDETEVSLGDLTFDADPLSEGQEHSKNTPSVSDVFNTPKFLPYVNSLGLLVVHALVLRNEVTDPILIDDIANYIREEKL